MSKKNIIFLSVIAGGITAFAIHYFHNNSFKTLNTITPAIARTLYHPEANTVAGNPQGSITMVEFFGYNCFYCRKSAPVLSAFIKKHPNLRVVFKEYLV